MATETVTAKPKNNALSAPSMLRRYGSQMGIIGVGIVMWLAFVIAAPAVFTNLDIYLAFAQTTPLFGIIALALTFVVITGEIDLSFPSIMALGTAISNVSSTNTEPRKGFSPVTNIWCAQTRKARMAIANNEPTIAM